MKQDTEKQKLFHQTVSGLRSLLRLGKPEITEVTEDPKSPESSSDDPASEDAPDLQAQLDQANETIRQRDAQITALESQVDQLQTQLNTQQTTLNELVEEVKILGNRSAKKPVEKKAAEDLQKTEKPSPFAHFTQQAIDQFNNTLN